MPLVCRLRNRKPKPDPDNHPNSAIYTKYPSVWQRTAGPKIFPQDLPDLATDGWPQDLPAFSNGKPQVWITEQLIDKVTQLGAGAEFDTVALSGRILEVRDQEVIIETSGERMLFPIGQPFSAARTIVEAE